jgi:hypothetical protein
MFKLTIPECSIEICQDPPQTSWLHSTTRLPFVPAELIRKPPDCFQFKRKHPTALKDSMAINGSTSWPSRARRSMSSRKLIPPLGHLLWLSPRLLTAICGPAVHHISAGNSIKTPAPLPAEYENDSHQFTTRGPPVTEPTHRGLEQYCSG